MDGEKTFLEEKKGRNERKRKMKRIKKKKQGCDERATREGERTLHPFGATSLFSREEKKKRGCNGLPVPRRARLRLPLEKRIDNPPFGVE